MLGERFALTISGVAWKNGRDCSVCCARRSRRSRRNQSKWLDNSSVKFAWTIEKNRTGNERGGAIITVVIEIGVYNKVVIYVFLIIRLLFYAHRLYLYIPRENFLYSKRKRSKDILDPFPKFFLSLILQWKTRYWTFSGELEKWDHANFNREKEKVWNSDEISAKLKIRGRDPRMIWGEDVGGKERRRLGKVFGRCFNGRVSHCSKGLGRKEQLALVTPTVVELTRKMLSTLRGVGEGKGERRVGRCEWSKKASAEYNNYFTSDLRGPGNWNFRATPGTKAAGTGAPSLPRARGTEHFQLWHYNLLPVPRRMRAAATCTDYINLISSSLTVSTDPPPLLPNYSPLRPFASSSRARPRPILRETAEVSLRSPAPMQICNVKFVPRLKRHRNALIQFFQIFRLPFHLETRKGRIYIYIRFDFSFPKRTQSGRNYKLA